MLSAAEILGFGELRGELVHIPDRAVLCLHLAGPTTTDARNALGYALARLAESWDVVPQRIVVLEQGITLEALGDADLEKLGLQRIAPNPHPELAPAEVWRDAVLDLMVCAEMWPQPGEAPRAALHRVLAYEQQVALDPRVSSEAAALVERGRRGAAEA